MKFLIKLQNAKIPVKQACRLAAVTSNHGDYDVTRIVQENIMVNLHEVNKCSFGQEAVC